VYHLFVRKNLQIVILLILSSTWAVMCQAHTSSGNLSNQTKGLGSLVMSWGRGVCEYMGGRGRLQ